MSWSRQTAALFVLLGSVLAAELAAETSKPRAEALATQAGSAARPARTRRAPRRPLVGLGLLSFEPAAEVELSRAARGLSTTVARRTSVEMDEAPPPFLSLSSADLFEHPLVFLSGSVAMPAWSEEEVAAMGTYLSHGGMLVVDDRSGQADSAFVQSVRRQLSRATGGREFEALDPTHAVFRSYYLLERAWGRVEVSTELEAILLDGRAAVVLSSNDLLGALSRDEFGNWSRPVHPGGRAQREHARRLGVNLVLYALTLDYKEDLVHLPHILERRR